MISYCVRNGAYTGCDLPDVVLAQQQQSPSDSSESAAEYVVESVNPDSSQDLPANTDVPPACDDNHNVASFPVNGFAGGLSDLMTDMERTQVDESLQCDQHSHTEPSDNRSAETGSGNNLSNAVREAADSFSVENVSDIIENQNDASEACQMLVASSVLAQSCEFDSDLSPVTMNSANLSPAAKLPLYSLSDISMQESAPDNNAVEHPNCETDSVEKQDTNYACQLLVDSTVVAESCEFDAIPPPLTMVLTNLSALADVHSLTNINMQESAPDADAVKQPHCEMDTAEKQDTNQTCPSLVAGTVMAENGEFGSVLPAVDTMSANLLPADDVPVLKDNHIRESVPNISAVEQPHCEVDTSEKQDTNQTCPSLVSGTVTAENGEFGSVLPLVDTMSANLPSADDMPLLKDSHIRESVPNISAVEQPYCEPNTSEKQDTNPTCPSLAASTVMVQNGEFGSVLPPVGSVSANLPLADDVHSLTDTQESVADIDAVEWLLRKTDAAEDIDRQPYSEFTSQSSPQSVENSHNLYDKDGSDAEQSVTTHSISADVSHIAIDSRTEITTAETSSGSYMPELPHITCSVDPQILSSMKSVEKSLAESGLNGKAAGSCQNVSVHSPNQRQSSSDQLSAPPVSSGSGTAQRNDDFKHDITDSDHTHLGNLAVALNVAAETTVDTSSPCNGNAEANYEAQSPVLTVQPAVASGKCVTALPTNIELQRKIIRQMEVCIQLLFFFSTCFQNFGSE